ncbi:MAG: PP2C family protein-serine/threonine phosphatase [candidate division KSB1 bacterium]|nr:PP2C family protein-serine/threonine phosphatase [candidate division KSB1 bacterium]MDZ7275767.1 PP2C family protein-serine/threonine phosphatase [candidate division KSB1 bacterium]MDZ7284542.1 PP2C family protein-serine/threonine phosphatase [candidate division KSB1 bacterium]MDZ7298039.1 PP2C family protein-serine/threonine phosphatase [candidate division KSB1 bacterium]MDZ7309088.1 PP2C family protein-serine/threonine phosphatase [candidate division KSB1 bacterium]
MNAEAKTASPRENLLLLLLALAGAALFFELFQPVTPAAKLGLELNRGEAESAARDYLKTLDHNVTGFDYNVALIIDNKLESFLQAHNVTAAQRKIITRHHPVAAWEVIYRHPETSERFQLRLSPQGEVFHCEHMLPPNVAGERMPLAAARLLVRDFLVQHRGIDWQDYETVDAQMIKQEARTDHNFIWENRTPATGGLRLRLKAVVLGDRVGGWMQQVQYPREFSEWYTRRLNTANWFKAAEQILFILLFVISLVIFVLRFRAGEVGLRNALLLAGFAFICVLLLAIDTLPAQAVVRDGLLSDNRGFFIFATYINLLLLTLAAAVGIFIVWMSGETFTREVWPEKLRAFDALFAGRMFFPELGQALLRGSALAFVHLGASYLLFHLLVKQPGHWLVSGPYDEEVFAAFMPFALPLLFGIYHSLLLTAYAPLFTLGFLRRRFHHTLPALLLTAFFFCSVCDGTVTIHDRWLQAALALVASSVIYIFYLRYDLLTVAAGLGMATALPGALSLALQPDGLLRAAGMVSLGLLAGLLLYGYAAARHGKPVSERAITPRYVRYLSERERLKMELEIARKAQLRMLPQHLPRIAGLDIAACSEPAREVGGDYYDFVMLDEQRLGVVIGDVSGKGMPAALYMTLTKGFLQAHASPHASPGEILCRMNRAFYATADRNVFVSLFYLVIDPVARRLTCARAGHNPVIVHPQNGAGVRLLQPPGIALGLERGEIFDRILQQEQHILAPGDTLVLYTDGLTEAMNHRREEFGEHRLLEVIARNQQRRAPGLLDAIRQAHREFIGREDQYDDLTCVVVKLS